MKIVRITTIVMASLAASCGGCDNTVVASALSPDGHFLAVLNERDCDATTNFARSIQIRSTEKSTLWERAQVSWTRDAGDHIGQTARVPELVRKQTA